MKIISISAAFIFVLATFTVCFADTIHVPADQPTIQDGIDAAATGDKVLVAPGTYLENINFLGKAITVESSGGAAVTMVDGGNPINPDYGSTVTFSSGEGLDSVLKGFTITGGTGTYHEWYGGNWRFFGGGIFCCNSSPKLMDNVVTGNSVSFGGGGIYCEDSSPTLTNIDIHGNAADERGGGISCVDSSLTMMDSHVAENTADNGGGIYGAYATLVISNSTVTLNTATYDGGGFMCGETTMILTNLDISDNIASSGGGIYCEYYSFFTLNGCNISRNTIIGTGGGIYCYYYSYLKLTNSTVIGNTAGNNGGGVFFDTFSSGKLMNNTVSGNSADFYGGGVYNSSSTVTLTNNSITGNTAANCGGGILGSDSETLITNTILWGNSAPTGPEAYLSWSVFSNSITISNSDVQGGQSSVYVDPNSTLNWGLGMIDADPLFVDEANGDYHLVYDSPCRDAGDNSVVTLPEDFESDPRIAHGTVDIGADEFYNHLYCTGDFTPSGTIAGKFIGLPGTTPVGLFIGSGVMDSPLQHKWGEFFLESPWLLFPLVPIPANGVLETPANLPATPAPYDIPMQALIGWELSNLFVLEVR